MASSETIKVLIANEQPLLREALRLVLEREGDLEVVAEAKDSREVVAEAERSCPDVAVIEVGFHSDGMSMVSLIRERAPSCRVLAFAEEQDQGVLVAALEAGASGFLTKRCPLTELTEAVRTVHRGETVISPTMLGELLSELLHRRREQNRALRKIGELTRREREVLAYVAKGLDPNAIAEALVISPETARTHIQHMLGRLGVHSRLEAASLVFENDLHQHLIDAD